MTSGRSDVAEDDFGKAACGGGSRLDSESCELLRRVLGNKDMCHHPAKGQILTTTDALACAFTVDRKSEDFGLTLQDLKF